MNEATRQYIHADILCDLAAADCAALLQDANKFQALKGDRAGDYAVTVTGNMRITFRFDGQHATAVNLEDDH